MPAKSQSCSFDCPPIEVQRESWSESREIATTDDFALPTTGLLNKVYQMTLIIPTTNNSSCFSSFESEHLLARRGATASNRRSWLKSYWSHSERINLTVIVVCLESSGREITPFSAGADDSLHQQTIWSFSKWGVWADVSIKTNKAESPWCARHRELYMLRLRGQILIGKSAQASIHRIGVKQYVVELQLSFC